MSWSLLCLLAVSTVLLLLINRAHDTEAQVSSNFVELSVREPLGVDRPRYPVTMGVPFPQGVLNSVSNLRVEADGEALPLQARPLAVWPDDSVKWVLLDFQRDLAYAADNRCRLYYGEGVQAEPKPETAVTVNETNDSVEVNTGPLQFAVGSEGLLPLRWVHLNGKTVLPDGGIGCRLQVDGKSYLALSTQAPVVEEPGPLRVVIRAEGKAYAERWGE